ncbi:hypothetical protein ILUMI_16341, partial [Ignelater luminosus]
MVKTPGCSECSVDDASEWLMCDSSDLGFQIRNDNKLIQSMREELIKDPEVEDDSVLNQIW